MAARKLKKRMEKIKHEVGPEVSGQIKRLFSGMRKEVSSKMSEIPEFKTFFANPAFNQGVAIVEKYDFGLPRFTEKFATRTWHLTSSSSNRATKNLLKCSKSSDNGRRHCPSPPAEIEQVVQAIDPFSFCHAHFSQN